MTEEKIVEKLEVLQMREDLAAYAHEAWSGWMRHLFRKCEMRIPENGMVDELVIPAVFVERWQRQMITPYRELPEGEKESDRKESDAILATIAASMVKRLLK